MSRPIVLRTEALVPSNSDTEAPAGPMMNASGEAVEIHSFKFSLRPADSVIAGMTVNTYIRPVSGGQFGVSLSVKDPKDEGYAITKGPVPLWSFGPSYGLGDEVALQVLGTFAADPTKGPVVPTATYIWKLDHPLYVPAGCRIVPVFRSIGNFTFDVVAGITAVGCTVEHSGKQSTYKVPWVASFVSKSDKFNTVGVQESSPQTIQNPHDKPVFVERFTGRIHLMNDTTTVEPTTAVTDTALYAGDLGSLGPFLSGGGVTLAAEAWFDRCFTVQMADSMGNPLVRVPTLFRGVFDPAVRSWEVKHVLPPEQYFRVLLAKDNAGLNVSEVGLVGNLTRAQASITMVGWREVSWQRGGK